MAGPTQRTDQRKRNRKRKRRNVSLSSSSESSDSSDGSSDEQVVKLPTTKTSSKAAPPRKPSPVASSSSEEEDSSSDSDSEHDEPVTRRKSPSATSHPPEPFNAQDTTLLSTDKSTKNPHTRPPSPPPLRNVPAPQPIPPGDAAGNLSSAEAEKDKELKDRFRKFWMSSIADAFSDDLNEIRKEPNLTQSRLGLLIDSLASGADLYSTSREMGDSKVNEIGIILGDKASS